MNIIFQLHPTKKKPFWTHRQLVIDTAVAVVTGRGSRGVQPEHHLIPILELAQAFREPHDTTFGQLFKLLDHFLAFIHCVKTVHPKHDLHLDLQREHISKWFVVGINQATAIHLQPQ